MHYDNERDRHEYGYDAGQIVDGVVTLDPNTGHFVLMDDEGIGYDSQAVLQKLKGQKIRITIISIKSMEEMQKMMEKVRPPN
jgi:sensor c-di-GMP phosphodiesterase-like protein